MPSHFIEPVEPTNFDPGRSAPIQHDFHRHPLLQIDALGELARRLMPLGQCRFIRPGMRLDSAFDHSSAPADGRTLDDVLRRIEEPGSWLALYDAQVDPLYRGVLDEVQAHIERLVAPSQRVRDVRSFLFLSAPPSVTPFHIDRENNFWLQIRGHKTLTLWDHRDRSTVSAQAVEDFILHSKLQGVQLRQELLERGARFECGPGEGVYFPSTTPHMTESRPEWNHGDTLSISVGMVFYTNVTRRHSWAYMLNPTLRALGLDPRPPGESAMRDRLKGLFGRSLWQMRGLYKRR